MATISRSFGDETLLKKAAKEKNKRNVEFTTKDAPLKSKRKSRNITKETNCSEPVNSKTFAGIEQEAEWDHAFGEELSVPVPDLYPELSDSLANLQHRDTEQDQMAKVRNEDEDNVQCVPNTFDDHGLEDNNNPGTSQSQGEFQISSPYNQTQSNKKGKRKLAKPRKVAKSKRVDQGKNTGTATEEDSINFVCVQETGKQGTWAQCSIPSCHKWRFLQDSIDPNEIPERWVCAMNENDNYNTCSVSQETFDSQDGNLNVMYTPYPRGAIVWAKLVGYPWWPAMMEDDPDFGYYCETDDDGVTPVMYHVVFFDKEVSRTWINAFGIRNFSIDDDPEDMGKSVCRGKNYRRQLVAAATEARRAAQMPLEVRLAKYGFAARYKGPIGIKTIEEKESFRNCFDDREFSDSESSSQEIYSSGNSYGTESNSSSSSDELKIKTSIKSSTHKDKPAKRPFQGKPNKSAKAKGSDSSAKKQKEIREKKTQAKKGKKLSGLTTKDISKSRNKCRDNEDFKTQHVRNVSEPSDKRSIEEDLRHNAKYTSVCGTKELQTSDPSVLSTTLDSKQTTSGNEENIKRLHEQRPPENSCSGAKTVKKRRPSFKVERGVKKTNNGEITRDNSGNNLDSIERKDKEEVIEKVATSTKLSTKAPRKKRVSKGQIATEEDAKIDTNPANDAGEDKEIISKLSISSKFKLGASKEKQRKGEPHKGDKSTSQCAVTDINKNEDENGTLDSLGNTDKGKSKQSNPRKNQSKKVTKKKSSSPEASGEHGEFKVGNEENKTLRTEVSGGVRTFKDHSEHSENRKPSFVLKRSPACTDLRVSMGEETSQKRKPLPKLKKVFKPPVAKANKVDEVRKLPNLLKPHFVSPARSELEHKSDNQNADREETTQSNIVMKGTMKEVGTKRKASNFDQYHGSETQKKTKDDREKSDVLSEDLQAEISEIDNDIANMKEQLGISDTSNTSISEETNVSAAADQQGHPDSPEF